MCNVLGSVGKSCDDDGKCKCIEKVEGDKCKKCIKDHYDWPKCKGNHFTIFMCTISAIP